MTAGGIPWSCIFGRHKWARTFGPCVWRFACIRCNQGRGNIYPRWRRR